MAPDGKEDERKARRRSRELRRGRFAKSDTASRMPAQAVAGAFLGQAPRSPSQRLLRWFRSARRDLPWRTPFPRDPYAVLVSEVMLQQTQVERVIAVFHRFMECFPSLEGLAAASTDEAVRAFSGLGYYRRARLLHRAAQAIVERGSWPSSARELARLPGFGPYTSAAVTAFCFDGSDPPVDGNVARVTARVLALELALGSPALLKRGRDFAAGLYAESPTAEVWEALIELGATVCAPVAPRCEDCPLAIGCAALATRNPQAYPRPRPHRSREEHRWVALWLERDDGHVLLRCVENGSLLLGLWLPPFAALPAGGDAISAAEILARDSGFPGPLAPAPVVRHSITHRDIRVLPFRARMSAGSVSEPRPGWRWCDPDAPQLPTSALLAKLAEACKHVHSQQVGHQKG
jgi:A/G-specific adenine glycosylase